MNTLLRFSALTSLFLLSLSCYAQLTYTNDLGRHNTESTHLQLQNYTAVQTFSGFTNISKVSWQVRNVDTVSSATATFNAYIAVWNADNSVSSLQQLTPVIAGGSSGAVSAEAYKLLEFTHQTITPLNANGTYALLLSYVSGDTSFQADLTLNAGGTFFGSGGTGVFDTSVNRANFLTALATPDGGGTPNTTRSYQLTIEGIAATPEPKTAAAAFAGLFVVGLVGRRMWQQRKSAVQPGTA